MNKRRYTLEPYKGMITRYHCPGCRQRDKTFARYIDIHTGEHVHATVGRCNRESNCGYHYTPKQYFQDNNISIDTPQPNMNKTRPATPQPKPISFIPVEVFKASLKGHETNHFVKFLIDMFGVDITLVLVSRYFIASSKHWNGATVFWQIDVQGRVRTGKIMLYNPDTGKRVKEPFNHITWVHSLLKQPDFGLKQCFFGEHLLIDKTKPVAIVESEKTAVIASVYLPEFNWLAVGSLTNLNEDKCSVLRGRTVLLFPDLNGFEKWSSKAKELSHIAMFSVSDLLERKATDTERKQGLDLADYLIKFDWRLFRKQDAPGEPPPPDPLKFITNAAKINEKVTFFAPQRPESYIKNINSAINVPSHPEPEFPQLKPLKPATGRLAELEDIFINKRAYYRNKGLTEQIIRLLDNYKRNDATISQLHELSKLMGIESPVSAN